MDQTERGRSLEEIARQIETCRERSRDADRALLAAAAELAELYLNAETASREADELGRRSSELTARRRELAEARQRLRGEISTRQERRHRLELAAGEVRHERTTLAERLREDYAIEIADIERPISEDEQRQREEIDEEIAQLRRKLNSIGAVNLDALLEVEELEQRFGKLSSQHQDLLNAKDALEKIIVRINADSRRLFAETLEAIRQNFQAVFRKVFGGGRADIVLEEGADILDAGIDIVATPPGKQSLSISLLSGGERALTAVSLMLAIFQFRPSPFCILDEVDGPLDEANIGRFLDQLNEYLTWTRFVIVTHSKKTMTAATTLYGVTMQESGVSKRVSVKFDDVTETGHIRQEAVEREPTAASSTEDERAA
jgi:chromosome segregation protein